MRQVGRMPTAADQGLLVGHRVLICDRDAKWSAPVRRLLSDPGIRVVQTPYRAPNANAYAERFVRSIRDECLDRVMPFVDRAPPLRRVGGIRRRQRLGGLLNYYYRAA